MMNPGNDSNRERKKLTHQDRNFGKKKYSKVMRALEKLGQAPSSNFQLCCEGRIEKKISEHIATY